LHPVDSEDVQHGQRIDALHRKPFDL